MPFFNRRVGLFLLLDAAILLALMGIFAAVNHAFVPAPKTLSENISITPTVEAIPQTLTAHRAAVPIVESSPGDEFNLAKLRSKTVKVVSHAIAMGENYWTIAKNNNIDIYTLSGANPSMPFKAKIKESLNLLSRKGVLYTAQKGDDPSKIAALFGSDAKTIKAENGLTWWKGLKEGDVVFVPSVK